MKRKRILVFLFAGILLMGMQCSAFAAQKAAPVKAPAVAKTRAVLLKNTYGDITYCSFWTGSSKDVILSMTSSNPKVASLTKKNLVIRGVVKKAGKTVFTVKVKRSGKTYTLRQTLTVYAYKPFKTLKIGNSMNYAANINYDQYAVCGKSGKERLNLVLNTDWTLQSMYYIYSNGTSKLIKNGKLINLDDSGRLKIKVYHKKTKTSSICYLVW